MIPERHVGGARQESEDRKNRILRFEKTTQDPLRYCDRIDELIGGLGSKGKANFGSYEGVEIPTIDEWLNEITIWQLTQWITRGIAKHYTNGNDNLSIVLSFTLGKAMEEGIKNALEHGNKENSEKKVLVEWKLRKSINISIIDEGTEIIDLKPKSHISGDLLDEVFSGGGNGVKIIKRHAKDLGGTAAWIPVNNEKGQKIGTELKINVPM